MIKAIKLCLRCLFLFLNSQDKEVSSVLNKVIPKIHETTAEMLLQGIQIEVIMRDLNNSYLISMIKCGPNFAFNFFNPFMTCNRYNIVLKTIDILRIGISKINGMQPGPQKKELQTAVKRLLNSINHPTCLKLATEPDDYQFHKDAPLSNLRQKPSIEIPATEYVSDNNTHFGVIPSAAMRSTSRFTQSIDEERTSSQFIDEDLSIASALADSDPLEGFNYLIESLNDPNKIVLGADKVQGVYDKLVRIALKIADKTKKQIALNQILVWLEKYRSNAFYAGNCQMVQIYLEEVNWESAKTIP